MMNKCNIPTSKKPANSKIGTMKKLYENKNNEAEDNEAEETGNPPSKN